MTVSLVIVSHSAQLAKGAVELARQMTKGVTPVAAAGGTGQFAQDGSEILGTSADIILAAIQSVEGPDGSLVLLDMGSALLSTEMALELLDEEKRRAVTLTFAPLVEGTITAALEASLGHSLAEVKRAAEQTAQREQLQQMKPVMGEQMPEEEQSEQPAQPAPPPSATGPAREIQLTLHNPTGLHARPASLFVQTAGRFKAKIQVFNQGKQADATSIMSILSLNARQGDTLVLRASGADADAALEALDKLAQANFYETSADTQDAVLPPPTGVGQPAHVDSWRGIPTSAGVALGPAFLFTSSTLDLRAVEHHTISVAQVPAEKQRLQDALNATAQELDALAQQLQERVGAADAAIFEAQALMLGDPELLEHTFELITQQSLDAPGALATAGEKYAAQLETLDNSLLAARAVDVRDATSRALRHLGIGAQATPQQDLSTLAEPVILVARDLTPSDTARLQPATVLGICTTQGGPTAHASILARALGIPAIAGLDEAVLQRIHSGDELGLDADKGTLYIRPGDTVRKDLQQRLAEQRQRQATMKAAAQSNQAPITIGKHHILMLANVGSEAEAEAARQWGAEGIGLLRTEFLFAKAATLPDEQAQRVIYRQVFQAFLGNEGDKDKKGTGARSGGPIVARTLDAGADKPMPALQREIGAADEANPALGLRGLRIHLAHQHLLKQQLRALILAAADTGVELHIMCPMVTTVEELQTVRSIFNEVHEELKRTQANVPAHIPLGIMVEVPAAAIMAPELAALADFFSIGANDLLQYTLATDRTNTSVASLYNPMQPAVLRLIHTIAEAGERAGKPVAVCGEIASDPELAPVLLGLGVNELSMTPTALPKVRAVLAGRTETELSALAARVLNAHTVAEVRDIISGEA